MSKPITWTNDQICLGALKPWENNPRYSTEQQAERISDSHRMFGQVETIAIGPDGSVYNGHERLSAWLAEYGPDYVVDVRRCSRKLKDDERQALTAMLHAGAVGSWDFDTLANWDSDILQGFGFDEDLLKGWQRDTFALGDLLASEDGGEIEHITVGRLGQLYRHDIEPFKLAYRVEAIWRARGGKAIDLFSGESQLDEWY